MDIRITETKGFCFSDGETHVKVLGKEVIRSLELGLHVVVRRRAGDRRAREEAEDAVSPSPALAAPLNGMCVCVCVYMRSGNRARAEGDSPRAEGAHGPLSRERGDIACDPARRLEAARTERAAG